MAFLPILLFSFWRKALMETCLHSNTIPFLWELVCSESYPDRWILLWVWAVFPLGVCAVELYQHILANASQSQAWGKKLHRDRDPCAAEDTQRGRGSFVWTQAHRALHNQHLSKAPLKLFPSFWPYQIREVFWLTERDVFKWLLAFRPGLHPAPRVLI